jgi:putative peptide zinc metalloprotease protein
MPRDISELDKLWLTPAAEPELGPFVQPPPKQPPAKKPSPEPPAATRTSRPRKRSEPPPTLTAAVFTDEQMLGGGRKVPERGWRRAIYSGTSGRLNPGPGAAERREAELLARVRTPIQGSRRVVVMSRKGGVGKTTLTLALGSTFSMMRGDRVVAVDANPDAGNLAHRVAEPNDRTITDVLADIERISSYADLRGYTSQGVQSRLEVLASDDDARISQALDRQAYHRVIDLLDHYYNLIMLDTGTGILDSANQGLLSEADQLVLVLRPALDGARAAALTLDWLTEHEYGGLVSDAVVVVNATRQGVGLPLDKIEDHFAQRCAQVLQIPWDRALERGAQTDLSNLAPGTRHALVKVAAAVADNFSQRVSAR